MRGGNPLNGKGLLPECCRSSPKPGKWLAVSIIIQANACSKNLAWECAQDRKCVWDFLFTFVGGLIVSYTQTCSCTPVASTHMLFFHTIEAVFSKRYPEACIRHVLMYLSRTLSHLPNSPDKPHPCLVDIGYRTPSNSVHSNAHAAWYHHVIAHPELHNSMRTCVTGWPVKAPFSFIV